MYDKYISALVTKINSDTSAYAQEYFGELEKPENGDFLKNSLPAVYIDFIEDDTSSPREIDIKLSLYIVNIAYSKNRQTRQESKNEIHTLLKEIYSALAFQTFEDSQPLQLSKLKKIFDASSSGGYLSVYQKEVLLSIPNPILGGV